MIEIIESLERLREELHMSISKEGLNSKKTMKISEEFNKVLNAYYENGVGFSTESIMFKGYIRTIKALKRITKDFSKFPTVDEWNKYAKEHILLSSESIKYITGINWHDIRNKIK